MSSILITIGKFLRSNSYTILWITMTALYIYLLWTYYEKPNHKPLPIILIWIPSVFSFIGYITKPQYKNMVHLGILGVVIVVVLVLRGL
jgi:hypothetical protein